VFTATVTGASTAITWAVDGTVGGSTTVGTITPAGIYTPPALQVSIQFSHERGGQHQKRFREIAVTDLPGVFTYHNDLARDGANTQELALTTATVTTVTFGKRFSCQSMVPRTHSLYGFLH